MQSMEPIYFAPQRKLGGGWICFKDSPSPPPAPNYTAAAQATASGNMQAAQQAQQANMVNQTTPYGSLTYSQDPTSRFGDNPSYSSQINLSPTGQSLLDANNNSSLGLAGLQGGAEQRVAQTMSQSPNLDPSSAVNQAYSNITSRLNPQWAQNTEMQQTQLANQGLTPGMQAYDNSMRDFNNAKNDAYTQANTTAMNYAPTQQAMSLQAYNNPLNELNAIRSSSQVTTPSFGSSPQQQTTTGPNMLGATQATGQYNQGLYNAGVGQANSFNQGLFSLGGSAMMAAGGY